MLQHLGAAAVSKIGGLAYKHAEKLSLSAWLTLLLLLAAAVLLFSGRARAALCRLVGWAPPPEAAPAGPPDAGAGALARAWRDVLDAAPAAVAAASAPLASGGPGAPAPDSAALAALSREVHAGEAACPRRFEVRGWHVGKAVSIYDGDTLDLVLLVPQEASGGGGKLLRFRARTIKYNAPELRLPPDAPDRDRTKRLAEASRERLWWLATGLPSSREARHGRLLMVRCLGQEKYGRLLVELYALRRDAQGRPATPAQGEASINDAMLAWLGPQYAMDDKGSMVHKGPPPPAPARA